MPSLLNDFYQPVQLITVYYRQQEEEYYLEQAPVIHSGEGRYQAGASSALRKEQLSALADHLAKKERIQQGYIVSGMLPEEVIGFNPAPGAEMLVWYNKAQPRHLSFAEGLHIPNGLIHMPPLLFQVKINHLTVYALEKNKKPVAFTRLMRAPFHNTNNEGRVCMGSAKLAGVAGVTLQQAMTSWERAFFMSEFTHLTGESPIQGNLNVLYKEMSGTKKPFPMEVLKPLPQPRALKDLFK